MMRVSIFDSEQQSYKELEPIDEFSGKLDTEDDEDHLMHSVIESDKDEVEDGRLIVESINQGITNFTPDMIFRNMVNNYQMAEKTYGETLIRKLAGYNPNYIKKNINIPEFINEIKSNIEDSIDELKKKKLLDKDGDVTKEAIKLSSLILYTEELDKLILKGYGDKKEKKSDPYGDKEDIKSQQKLRFRDLALKQSVKTAIRRGHKEIQKEDLRAFERRKRGKVNIIYALDSSGSMKGNKIGMGKRAGIALAYKALQEKNKVGLIVFDANVTTSIAPCDDFNLLLNELARIKTGMETNLSTTIQKATELFPKTRVTKHLILITDALPTKGQEPVNETLEAASIARSQGITISVLGINLDKEGLKLAKNIAEVGSGRLYTVKNLENMDTLVLEDYYSVA